MPDWTFYLRSLRMATPSFQLSWPEFSDTSLHVTPKIQSIRKFHWLYQKKFQLVLSHLPYCYCPGPCHQSFSPELLRQPPSFPVSTRVLLLSVLITPAGEIYVLSQIVSCLLTTLQCFQKMNFTAFISWVHFKWLHSVETRQTPPWPSEKGWCYQGFCVGFTNPRADVKRRAPHLWGSVSENPSPWLVMRKTSDKPSLGPTLHDTWPALLNTVRVMKSEERVSKTNTD